MPNSGTQRQTGQQIVTTVPEFPANVSNEIAVLVDPNSGFAQAMLASATKLKQMYVDGGVRSFCFTADGPQTGTTVVSVNIAAALAAMGLKTLLIEANFSRPRLARMFDLPADRPGLAEWIAALHEPQSWSLFISPAYPGLAIVHAGKAGSVPAGALTSVLPQLVSELSRIFDVVLLDAPPLEDEIGLLPALASAECTIVVARQDMSKVGNMTRFEDIVRKSHSRLGGFIYLGA